MTYELILASGSPRRRQFLQELGLPFTVLVADIDETPQPDEDPVLLAQRLAEQKAHAVAARLPSDHPPCLIIAADTVVGLGPSQLGKPGDAAEATAMLETLRDREHQVHSAISVLEPSSGRQRTLVNSTQVRMRNYTAAEVAAYVATGDPMDKAGGYAIQHREFAPVTAIRGCASGVIGLPLGDLADLLAEFGVPVPKPVAQVCQPHTDFRCCRS